MPLPALARIPPAQTSCFRDRRAARSRGQPHTPRIPDDLPFFGKGFRPSGPQRGHGHPLKTRNSQYKFTDEQALLAKVRYTRLIDTFLGITAYSLQNHLRTT